MGIEDITFKKIIDITLTTVQGHLDQERKKFQLTKTAQPIKNEDTYLEKFNSRLANIMQLLYPPQSIIKRRE